MQNIENLVFDSLWTFWLFTYLFILATYFIKTFCLRQVTESHPADFPMHALFQVTLIPNSANASQKKSDVFLNASIRQKWNHRKWWTKGSRFRKIAKMSRILKLWWMTAKEKHCMGRNKYKIISLKIFGPFVVRILKNEKTSSILKIK